MATTTTTSAPTSTRGPLPGALLLVLAGSAFNLVLATVGAVVFGLTFQSPQPPPDGPVVAIPLAMFALATLIPVGIGTLVAWAVGRWSRRAATAFIAVGAVLAVLSLAMPFTLPLTPAATAWMLGTHVVAGATFVLAARRTIG